MEAGQGSSGYFKSFASGFDDDDSSCFSESSEEVITDSSDDELVLPDVDSADSDVGGSNIDLDRAVYTV